MKTLAVFGLGLVVLGAGTFAAGDEKSSQKNDSQESPRQVGAKDVVHALIKVLKDKDEDEAIRSHAAQGLVGLGSDAVPSLIELLKGKDNDLRIKAATILANMKAGQGQKAVPILLKALKNKKEDKDFRRQAAFALSQIVAINRRE
jgi:HEAT repeat protein